ncbi:protein indeterminate-domain 12-like [Trifolium pratense]|uniref:protein indeterminate-domain 12-like n=1 Tax=Trifolium pratense TaxID=57577 RepID=UPI001E691183|nr:protein indeterminate-domain 12-like [Trifolium pratense]
MFPALMSNSTSFSQETTLSSNTLPRLNHVVSTINSSQQPQKTKKKRNLPGNPDPDAEVIALSPRTLLATNRFVCEICSKGFQRDQNLQLHRRGHNLPWKLKQRNNKDVIKKRAYVCPEPSCVHHNPSRALGDLTGIKKHFSRKHGEKKWKCDKCSKIYAVHSDWKAHSKTCGTREYKCDCGTLFSRKDSFITHRAFCDALAEESARMSANIQLSTTNPLSQSLFLFPNQQSQITWDPPQQNPNPNTHTSSLPHHNMIKHESHQNFHNINLSSSPLPSFLHDHPNNPNYKTNIMMTSSPFHVSTQQPSSTSAMSPHLSATALLQQAATVGATAITGGQPVHLPRQLSMSEFGSVTQIDSVDHYINNMRDRNLKNEDLTRDFLGLTNGGGNGGAVDVTIDMKDMLTFTGGLEYHGHQPHENMTMFRQSQQQGFGFLGTTATVPESWGNC